MAAAHQCPSEGVISINHSDSTDNPDPCLSDVLCCTTEVPPKRRFRQGLPRRPFSHTSSPVVSRSLAGPPPRTVTDLHFAGGNGARLAVLASPGGDLGFKKDAPSPVRSPVNVSPQCHSPPTFSDLGATTTVLPEWKTPLSTPKLPPRGALSLHQQQLQQKAGATEEVRLLPTVPSPTVTSVKRPLSIWSLRHSVVPCSGIGRRVCRTGVSCRPDESSLPRPLPSLPGAFPLLPLPLPLPLLNLFTLSLLFSPPGRLLAILTLP